MALNYINEIPELKQSHVHIKDPDALNTKIDGIIKEGFTKLQIVSDFDLTITKQHESGKLHKSSFRMFSHCPSITKEYTEFTKALGQKYRPYEFDPNIPIPQKRLLMEEWWAKSEEAVRGLKVSPQEIDEVIGAISPSLRDGTNVFLNSLLDNNVPVLVFSAGLGDTVVAVLKHFDVLLPNIKVISNFLNWDDNGTITGFKGRLIHVLNKNEFAIKDSEHHNVVKDRSNVILLGDSVGDATMADGISNAHHVLKIGFIWQNVEGNLPAYLDVFDIVLEDDQSMDIPRAIIELIAKAHK